MQTRANIFLSTTIICAMTLLSTGCNKPKEVAATSAPAVSVTPEINDNDLTMKVKTAILVAPDIKNLDITVVTLKGDVRLTGNVANQSQKDEITKIARGTEGVHAIHDELTIKK